MRYPAEVRDLAVDLRRADWKVSAIGAQTGVPDRTVARWCREAGFTRFQSAAFDPIIRESAVRLYVDKGLTARLVAERLPLAEQTVINPVRGAGETVRRRGTRPRSVQ